MTVATVNVRDGLITLRIRFCDDNVVNITESDAGIRVTTSSKNLLARRKADGIVLNALSALKEIGNANLPHETTDQKMERFRDMANTSSDIVDFARTSGLIS